MIVLDPDLDQSRAASQKVTRAGKTVRADRARTSTASTNTDDKTKSAMPLVPWAERIPTKPTLARFLKEAQAAVGLRGEVSVLLTTDKAIRRLNRDFRGKDKPTDVLSFPAEAGFVDELIAGDLAISTETALKQARAEGHALTCELKVLLLHGLLHLAGYDHEADTGQMARRERKLREKLRLPLGLIERVEAAAAPAKKKIAKSATAAKKTTAKKSLGKKTDSKTRKQR
jgi:probable rRNA maturation factor